MEFEKGTALGTDRRVGGFSLGDGLELRGGESAAG